jgi:hypothetical protein
MTPSLKARACLWRNAPTGGNAACPSSVSETLAYSRRAKAGRFLPGVNAWAFAPKGEQL